MMLEGVVRPSPRLGGRAMPAKPKHRAVPIQANAASRDDLAATPSRRAVRDLEGLRTKYALSADAFARMLGLSRTALVRLEKGEGPPDLKELTRIDRVVRILE